MRAPSEAAVERKIRASAPYDFAAEKPICRLVRQQTRKERSPDFCDFCANQMSRRQIGIDFQGWLDGIPPQPFRRMCRLAGRLRHRRRTGSA